MPVAGDRVLFQFMPFYTTYSDFAQTDDVRRPKTALAWKKAATSRNPFV